MKIPRNFTYSTSEIVIEYQTRNGSGKMIIDVNVYQREHTKIMRKLKDCFVTAWYQRPKEKTNE